MLRLTGDIRKHSFLSFLLFKGQGVRKIQRTEHRKQMTEDQGKSVSVFCHLLSDIWIHKSKKKLWLIPPPAFQVSRSKMNPKSCLRLPGLVYPSKTKRFIDKTTIFRWLILQRAIKKDIQFFESWLIFLWRSESHQNSLKWRIFRFCIDFRPF